MFWSWKTNFGIVLPMLKINPIIRSYMIIIVEYAFIFKMCMSCGVFENWSNYNVKYIQYILVHFHIL